MRKIIITKFFFLLIEIKLIQIDSTDDESDESNEADNNAETILINPPKAKSCFEKFEKLFQTSTETLNKTRVDLTQINDNYGEYKKLTSVDTIRFVLANIGYPNNKKSSSFNYLLTGSFEKPLPNSPESAPQLGGETLKPTRCYFNNSSNIKVLTNNYKSLKLFSSFDKAFDNYMKKLMNDPSVDEIIIELPGKKFPNEYDLFKDFVFLDLVGLNDENTNSPNTVAKRNEANAVRLNQLAVAKECVDAVLMFPGKRLQCTHHMIRQIWKIGLFSDLDERRPPKIIIANKLRTGDWHNQKELAQQLEGFNNERINESIRECLNAIFDYEPSRMSAERQEVIYIENKEANVMELVKRADSLCILEMNQTGLTSFETNAFNRYQMKLKDILSEIKAYKLDFAYKEAFNYMVAINKELQIKINTKVNMVSLREKDNDLQDRVAEVFEQNFYKKTLKQHNKDIASELELFVNSYISDYLDSSDTYQNESQRVTLLFDRFLNEVAAVYRRFIEALKQLSKKKKYNSFAKKWHFDLFDFKNTIQLRAKPIRTKIISSHKYIDDPDWESNLQQLEDEILGIVLIKSDEFESLFVRNLFEDRVSWNQLSALSKSLTEFEEAINRLMEPYFKIHSPNNCPEFVKQPLLFVGNRSNVLPTPAQLQSGLTREDMLRLNKRCPKGEQFWQLVEQGKVKSKLCLAAESHRQHFVQFRIDRQKKVITSVYNKDFIDNKMALLSESLRTTGTRALHPIFITSRLRRNKCKLSNDRASGYTRQLNILAKTLGKHMEPHTFVVFLFVEGGGNVRERAREFKPELDYYESLKRDNFDAILNRPGTRFSDTAEHDPVILCYLPERNLGIGRKRKVMMLFAEHLRLRRYYFIDDDIDEFYEYDFRIGHRAMKSTPHSAFKALDFMDKVMEEETAGVCEDLDEQLVQDWLQEVAYLSKVCAKKNQNSNDLKRVLKILCAGDVSSQRKQLLEALNRVEECDEVNKIKRQLLGDRSKIIGQVALRNRCSYDNGGYENRLQTKYPKDIK